MVNRRFNGPTHQLMETFLSRRPRHREQLMMMSMITNLAELEAAERSWHVHPWHCSRLDVLA